MIWLLDDDRIQMNSISSKSFAFDVNEDNVFNEIASYGGVVVAGPDNCQLSRIFQTMIVVVMRAKW